MAEELSIIFNDLKSVRTYLIKIGPSRRLGTVLKLKEEEANNILAKYNKFLEIYKSNIKKYSLKETTLVNKICEEFNKLYLEVISLCVEQSRKEYSFLETEMAGDTFDLKIALSLFPVLTNNEQDIKQTRKY